MGEVLEEREGHRRWLTRPAGVVTVASSCLVAAGGITALIVDRHQISWGDAPTWGATIAAVAAGAAALYQLALTRRQLHEQQEVFTAEFARQVKRDALVDAQLRQAVAAARGLEREQADKVHVRFKRTETVLEPFDLEIHMAVVHNESGRPIRHVIARIEATPASGFVAADRVIGLDTAYVPTTSGYAIRETRQDMRQAIIKHDEMWGFAFERGVDKYPDARMSVEFEDDAELRWRIDHDLSLRRIEKFTEL